MQSLFNQETVTVNWTDRSKINGIVHVEAEISDVPSLHIAKRIGQYLANEDKTSSIVLRWDGETQKAVFQTFVWKQLPVDAVGYIRGLLGSQANRFA